MDTRSKTSRFVVLVPHRDALKALEDYRRKLFAAGFPGAFSLPIAAPLVCVSRPFNRDELKELAGNIRALTNKTGGKIYCDGKNKTQENKPQENKTQENEPRSHTSNQRFAFHGVLGEMRFLFFGPGLSLSIEESLFCQTARAKVSHVFFSPILCAALIDPELAIDSNPVVEEAPAFSFRAAALANLAIRPLDSGAPPYSLEWKTGPLIWLPQAKEKRKEKKE